VSIHDARSEKHRWKTFGVDFLTNKFSRNVFISFGMAHVNRKTEQGKTISR